MAEFSLPNNSKIVKGEYFKDKTGSTNLKKVNVYRWNPDDGKNPRIEQIGCWMHSIKGQKGLAYLISVSFRNQYSSFFKLIRLIRHFQFENPLHYWQKTFMASN